MCDGMVAFQTRALSSSSSFTSSSPAHRLAASALLLLFTLLPHGHASGKTQTHKPTHTFFFSLSLLPHDTHLLNRHLRPSLVNWLRLFPLSCRSVRLNWLPLPLARSGCSASERQLRAQSHPLCESIHCPNESQQFSSAIEWNREVMLSAVTLLS